MNTSPDRDEQFLHEKLSADLHSAPVDLWPAVTEFTRQSPAPPPFVAVPSRAAADCAAGVAATGTQFTDLRDPAPALPLTPPPGMLSAMSGVLHLPADLWAGMQANHNLEAAADGTRPPGESCTDAFIPTTTISRTSTAKPPAEYETWSAMAESHRPAAGEAACWMQAEPEPAVRLFIESPKKQRLLGRKAP